MFSELKKGVAVDIGKWGRIPISITVLLLVLWIIGRIFWPVVYTPLYKAACAGWTETVGDGRVDFCRVLNWAGGGLLDLAAEVSGPIGEGGAIGEEGYTIPDEALVMSDHDRTDTDDCIARPSTLLNTLEVPDGIVVEIIPTKVANEPIYQYRSTWASVQNIAHVWNVGENPTITVYAWHVNGCGEYWGQTVQNGHLNMTYMPVWQLNIVGLDMPALPPAFNQARFPESPWVRPEDVTAFTDEQRLALVNWWSHLDQGVFLVDAELIEGVETLAAYADTQEWATLSTTLNTYSTTVAALTSQSISPDGLAAFEQSGITFEVTSIEDPPGRLFSTDDGSQLVWLQPHVRIADVAMPYDSEIGVPIRFFRVHQLPAVVGEFLEVTK